MSENNLKKIIKDTDKLTDKDITWYPLYPNNMIQNGLEGYYAFIYYKNENGLYCARKYTILFQYPTTQDGLVISKDEPEFFILFENNDYRELTCPPKYPDPSEEEPPLEIPKNGLSGYDVNNYGSFVCVFHTLEEAKHRALVSYKMIYVYVMSHLL